MVLTWEAKVVVAADAADEVDAMETNWKHKVTPDRGDLIMLWWIFCKTNTITPIKSFWSSDTLRWQRSGSTLAQVTACCLTAPNHYLNQSVNSSDIHIRAISQEMPQASITKNLFEKIMYLRFHSNFPGANELKKKKSSIQINKIQYLNYGTNNCWFPLARKWPTWKWTWIWILYGKIEKKCPRYFRRDSRGNPRDLNMCRTGRSAALSRGRKSMPPRRESMKLVVQQRKFT